MIRLISLIVHVDTDYCYVGVRRNMRGKKEGNERERERERKEGIYKLVNLS